MNLYGITDLAKRWQYTRQGVHNKMKEDKEFPKPIAIVNQRTLVFDEQDIIDYEKKRKELTDINHKHYITHGRFKYFLKHGYVFTKGKS
jgi:predicted DNA-binding transcriptional regulator AlpA